MGINVIKDGMIWRIGNGNWVNIWSDPWLPRGSTRRPSTPRGANIISRVYELIDPHTGDWDVPLLELIFWEEDVRIIRTIPVHVEMEDVIGWHFDNKGQFSVKSAYKVHRMTESLRLSRRGAGASISSERTVFWAKLWKIDYVPKVKHFLWRLCHNTLAVRRLLHRRGMELDTRCCMCHRLDEDGGHLFLRCKEVKQVWRALNLESIRTDLLQAADPIQMMQRVLKLEEKERMTVILLLWLWWDERNTYREEGVRRTAGEVAHVIVLLADKFQTTGNTQAAVPEIRQPSKWAKPPDGFLKMNSDGAFNPKDGSGG